MIARGFTLIELLVAVFITAIIAAMGYTALTQAATQRGRLAIQAERLLEVQRGMRTLIQDIELLTPRPVREPFGNGAFAALVTGSGSGNVASVGAAAGTSSNLAQQTLVILSLSRSSWANPVGLPRTELQRVNYLMEGDKLIRTHLPILDAAGELPTSRRVLLTGVEAISFRYMDAGHAWQTTWQNGLSTGPARAGYMRDRPVAIEITLKLQDWGTLTRIVEVAG